MRFLGSIMLLFFPTWCSLQSPPIYQFGTEAGLPSLFLYDLEIDTLGRLWITGENGTLIYDGENFKPLAEHLVPTSEIIRLKKSPDGGMWSLDLKGDLSIIHPDSIQIIDTLREIGNFNFIQFGLNDFGDRFFIKDDTQTVLWFDNQSGSYESKVYKMKSKDYTGKIIAGIDRSFVARFWGSITILDKNGLRSFPIQTDGFRGRLQITDWEDKYIFNVNRKLYALDPKTGIIDEVFTQFRELWDENIFAMYYSSKSELWFSMRSGVFRLSKNNGVWEKHHYMPGIPGGDIIEDWQGNMWFSTEQNGLFCMPKRVLDIRFYPAEKLPVNAIHIDQDLQYYLGYQGGLVEKRNKNFELLADVQVEGYKTRIYDVEYFPEKNGLYVAAKNLTFVDEKFQTYTLPGIYSFKGVAKGIQDTSIWFSTSAGSGVVEVDSCKFKYNTRTYAVFPINKELSYLGTLTGLVKYNNGVIEEKVGGVSDDIRFIAGDKYDQLWVATQNDGIIIMRNDTIHKRLSKENGLSKNNCSKILIDDQYAWVLNVELLLRIDLLDPSNIKIIGEQYGTQNFGITDFSINSNSLTIVTSKGIYTLNKKLEEQEDAVLCSISNVEVNEKKCDFGKIIQVNGLSSKIDISTKVISFFTMHDMQYQYKLRGDKDEWLSFDGKELEFLNLKKGVYTFDWRTRILGEKWQNGPSIAIDVKPLFSETFLSQLLKALLAILAGGGIFWLLNRQLNIRKNLQNQLQQAQIMSVRARMNPHFVFNALNSIQDFILSSNPMDANRFLGKFSRLMRNVLFSSDQASISLEKEIETLDLYLSLEELRFEEDLKYQLHIDPKIEPSSIAIPPLMIQPYVENSIKHGLLHKQGSKKLDLFFRLKGELLEVEIKDNGVGRAEAKKIRKKFNNHSLGKGMRLSEKHLALINKSKGLVHHVKIEDLKDQDNNPTGTRVILLLSLTAVKEIIENIKF